MENDEQTCPYCAEVIKAAAVKCRYCHEFLDEKEWDIRLTEKQTVQLGTESPGVAAVLSTVFPGLGWIFRGRIVQGLFFVGLLTVLALATLRYPVLLFGMVPVYVLNIFDAYYGLFQNTSILLPKGIAANMRGETQPAHELPHN